MPRMDIPPTNSRSPARGRFLLAAGFALLLAGAGFFWWQWSHRDRTRAGPLLTLTMNFLRPALRCFLVTLLLAAPTRAATFPGNARLTIADSTDRALTWHNPTQALTVSFWLKITPGDAALTSNMIVVADRADGTWSGSQLTQNHACAVYLDSGTGKVRKWHSRSATSRSRSSTGASAASQAKARQNSAGGS